MVRIGRQIPHFREVDPASIRAVFSDDRRFRYLLTMQFGNSLYGNDRVNKAAVILKNPSSADERAADSTIRKVETFIFRHLEDVRVLSILNIFGLRATDAADLNYEYEVKGAESVIGPWNDTTIGEVAGEADYVVVAWGNRSGIDAVLYEERVRKVKQILQSVDPGRVFEVRGKQEYKQPLHGMLWGYDHRLVPFLKLKEE
jgi:hypothetical protein